MNGNERQCTAIDKFSLSQAQSLCYYNVNYNANLRVIIMFRPISVKAIWDSEAKVWVATSEDILGLATEADTIEALVARLNLIIPDLMEANGEVVDEIPYHLISEVTSIAHRVH
jgi:predicted RNase H-like HicB family nuclease